MMCCYGVRPRSKVEKQLLNCEIPRSLFPVPDHSPILDDKIAVIGYNSAVRMTTYNHDANNRLLQVYNAFDVNDDEGVIATQSSPGGSQLVATAYTANNLNQYSSISTSDFGLQTSDFTPQFELQTFIWDPTEPVATRPLVWYSSTSQPFNRSTSYYTHDGNKNVSEVVAVDSTIAAHYEYSPFGAVAVQQGESATANPWRFSSEYAEDETSTSYYNYRHYDTCIGKWFCRDIVMSINEYSYVSNAALISVDILGERSAGVRPWNKPLNIPRRPPRPPVLPKIVIPPGPAIRSDGSLINAIADEMGRVYYSEVWVRQGAIKICNRLSPSAYYPTTPYLAYRKGKCKCCLASYLFLEIGDSRVYYFESANIINKPCNDIIQDGSIASNPSPYIRRLMYISVE